MRIKCPGVDDGSRRDVLETFPIAAASATAAATSATPWAYAASRPGLATRVASRDPAALSNSLFNIPPREQVYPAFMVGKWNVKMNFSGYNFPSKTIDRSELLKDNSIPGFQRCSIAMISDIGREGGAQFDLTIDEQGRADKAASIKSSIDSHLGYDACRELVYDPRSNPNRMGIAFREGLTRNAERIELFYNGRESELSGDTFVCAEYLRQVTFSLSTQFGVARQVVTNYAHFWTWKDLGDGSGEMLGNVLTAAYIDPQDALFFKETVRPVVVYSHDLKAKRF